MVANDIYVTSYFIPLTTVAKWPTPLGDQAVTRHWYVGWITFLMILSTTSVAVRFYAQHTKRIRKTGVDDFFIVFAWLFAICYTIATIWGVLYAGFDRHIWEDLAVGERSGFIAFIVEVFFLASTCLSKLSVLAFQRRLLQRTHNPRYTRAIDAAIVFTIFFWMSFFLILPLSCRPTEAVWKSLNIGYKDYKCIHRNIPDRLVGIFSVLSDVYALIIPELLIWRLRLEKKAKLILYIVFGSGLLVVGAGIGRTVWLDRLWTDPLRDLSWVGYDTMVWGGTEVQLSIVCASAPALKAFISNVKAGMTRAAGSRDASRNGSNDASKMSSRGSKCPRSMATSMKEQITGGKRILVTETVTLSSTTVIAPPERASIKTGPPPYDDEEKIMMFEQEGVVGELAPWPPADAEKPVVERSIGSMASTVSEVPSYSSTVPLHLKRPSLTEHRTLSEFELYHSQFKKDRPATTSNLRPATTSNILPRSSFSSSDESLPARGKNRMSLAEFLRSS